MKTKIRHFPPTWFRITYLRATFSKKYVQRPHKILCQHNGPNVSTRPRLSLSMIGLKNWHTYVQMTKIFLLMIVTISFREFIWNIFFWWLWTCATCYFEIGMGTKGQIVIRHFDVAYCFLRLLISQACAICHPYISQKNWKQLIV